MNAGHERLPDVNEEEQVAWIAERTGLAEEVVAKVLKLEFEYMIGVGIVDDPDHEFRYYKRDELVGSPHVVDTGALARDSQKLLGVSSEVARPVFESEHEFLKMRGLTE